MANKNLNNIVELSKEVPIFTILNTEENKKDILVLHTNTGYHFIGLDTTNKDKYIISYDEEMSHSKTDLLTLLGAINNNFATAPIAYMEDPTPVSGFPPLSTTNTSNLYHKGFKVIAEADVINALDEAGINHDNLVYKTIKLSNEHASLTQAESNYASRMASPVLSAKETRLKIKIAAGNAYTNVGFVGPAGTGKTETVKKLASSCGKNLLIMQGSAGVEVGDLISEFIPDESKPGAFKLKNGILARAMHQGDWILLDELNMMDARVIAGCNSLTDRTGILTLADGSTLNRHPESRFFIAMNAGYKGTSDLNEAFKSRFVWETFFDITKDQFMDWISIYDFKNTKFLETLYDNFRKVKDRFTNSHFETEVTFRSADAFMKGLISLMDAGESITEEALTETFNETFVNAAATVDAIQAYEMKELTDESEVLCRDLFKAFKEGEQVEELGTVELIPEPFLGEDGEFDAFCDIEINDDGTPVEVEKEEE